MSSITLRRCVVDRDTNKTMYDRVLEDVEALGDTILSKHEIDKTFFRAKPDFKGNIYYEKSGGKSFRAHFIAEVGSIEQGILRLQQTFEVDSPANNSPATPNSQHRRITKVDEPAESSSNNSSDVDMEDTPVGGTSTLSLSDDITLTEYNLERKVGDVYPARMLPEVEGPLFALDKAQLRQHDYRDADGNLIAAHEIYHVLADKLRVLDHGDGEPFVPTVPPMPERREPRTPAKRPRDDAADSAFDSFGSKASPAKKAKQTKIHDLNHLASVAGCAACRPYRFMDGHTLTLAWLGTAFYDARDLKQPRRGFCHGAPHACLPELLQPPHERRGSRSAVCRWVPWL
ncbi:hypothetical protein B0H14DRAFT_2640305 [Mycena olivaceomarginata]|nr:hypothetical protein B0H14DRAFT_2640305 [Mycena olivaceomarginata]